MITQKRLHQLLNYNKETGVFVWAEERPGSAKIGTVAGSIDKSTGYVRISVDGKRYAAHRLVFLWCDGYMPEYGIDHKDRDKANNKRENIREATHVCNMRNKSIQSNNKSGFPGVVFCEISRTWVARIAINRKHKFLGRFKSFSEAVCHRLAGEQCVDWAGCDSNSCAHTYVKENIQK